FRSASECSTRPSVDATLRQRAMRPSSASKMKASGIRAMPTSRSPTTPSCRKRIAAKIAPVPQNALARVNQSASWKSRSIEKWRFMRTCSSESPTGQRDRVLAANLEPVQGAPTMTTPRSLLITGAGSGIGAGLARERARAGHHGVASDLSLAAARQIAGEIAANGGSAEAVALDVTRDASVAEALAGLSRPVEVLVNNAGLQHVAPLEEFPMEQWD